MPFLYIHFPPFIVICSSSSLLIRNIQKFILRRAVSLRLFINTTLAQNAIQQIPFFRLLLPHLLPFIFSPFLYIPNYKPRSFYVSLRGSVQSQAGGGGSVGGTAPSPWALAEAAWPIKSAFLPSRRCCLSPAVGNGLLALLRPRASSAKKGKSCKTQRHGTFPPRTALFQLSASPPAVLISGAGLCLWSWGSSTCSGSV